MKDGMLTVVVWDPYPIPALQNVSAFCVHLRGRGLFVIERRRKMCYD